MALNLPVAGEEGTWDDKINAALAQLDTEKTTSAQVQTLIGQAVASIPSSGSGLRTVRNVTSTYTPTIEDATRLLVFDTATDVDLLVPAGTFPVGTTLEAMTVGTGAVTVKPTTGIAAPLSHRATVAGVRNRPEGTPVPYPVVMPSGVQNGDGLLVFIGLADESRTFTAPAGWQFLASNGPSGAGGYLYYYANATASMAGTSVPFQVSGTATPPAVWTATAFAGANPTSMIDGFAKSNAAGNVFNGITPTYTTTNPGCLEVAVAFQSSGNTVEPALVITDPNLTTGASVATDGTGTPNTRGVVAYGSAGQRPAGTALGGRTTPGGYGGTFTVAVRPAVQGGAAQLLAFQNQTKTLGQGADFYVTQYATDKWLVSGLLGA